MTVKTLIAALAVGAFFAAPALVPSANAQRADQAREQAIQECMALQKRDPRDGDEGGKSGGFQWHYRACMTNRGQAE
jgi:hypothetical protein